MDRYFRAYETANLVPLIERIREDERYCDADGVNVLTNAAVSDEFQRGEVLRALAAAEAAGRSGEASFRPQFSSSRQGLSYGLNPYTDWSLSLLQQRPDHAYLFLGLDWYSISDLGHATSWFEYLANPFVDTKDLYWHRLWAWILRRTRRVASGKLAWDIPIQEAAAAELVRKDGGLFIFHNRIPYLRPAGSESAKSNWYEREWKKRSVRTSVLEDLSLLRNLVGPRIVTFCTGLDSRKTLLEAGYEADLVFSWGAHPSRVFHPATLQRRDLWFDGLAHFS